MQSSGRAALLPVLFFFAPALSAWQSEDLALQSQRAKELMAAGKFEEAIPIYKRLTQAAPGNPGLLLNLALAEHMAGHEREAIPHFEAVLKTQPTLEPALLSLGAARLALNQPEQAAEQYRKLTEISADDSRAWYGLGKSYESIATDAFDRLRKAGPRSPFVAALVADTRVQGRQYREAFQLYQEALKQAPNLHGVHAALAEIYRKTSHSDWAEVEDAKERALPAADCATHPAECQFVAGHDLQALHLPRTPSPDALYWRAKAANELALQAFFRLGQLPASVEFHQLQAEIARNQNQHMQSVKEWKAALELAPGDPRLEQELAVSLFLAKDFKAALEAAAGPLKQNPRSPELNFVVGDSWLRLEDPEKAEPYLEAALAADPKLREADASLGLALARLGKYAEAVRHLEKSLELDEDGSLHYQLARAYQAAGSGEKARAAMAQYQEILKRKQLVPPQ
jgi:tetratricopeptide (TPR) repeat protein